MATGETQLHQNGKGRGKCSLGFQTQTQKRREQKDSAGQGLRTTGGGTHDPISHCLEARTLVPETVHHSLLDAAESHDDQSLASPLCPDVLRPLAFHVSGGQNVFLCPCGP